MRKALRLAVSTMALATGLALAGEAFATEGYFQHAYGLRHKALAGAGAASIEDGTGISINPAGLVGIGDQVNLGISVFVPIRGFKTSGNSGIHAVLPGDYKSGRKFFGVPTFAYVRQIDEYSAFAFSIFGNGGMNTTYKADSGSLKIGPFARGQAGVDLMQMFISAAYARKFGDSFSIGIAPLFAVQRFKAYGLSLFRLISTDPNNISDRGYSYSAGGGVRVGVLFQPSDFFSIGASYQTKMWMSKFKKYKGLFADGGDFDIPANLQVGIALKPTDALKLMVDYRHIFYSDVDSISNRGVCGFPGTTSTNLGGKNGCGFDWRDTNTIKVGLEYQWSDNLILRAGYAYTFPNPIRKRAVLFNTIAPGVIQHEITGGGTYRLNANNDIDFAFMFAPKTTVKGPEINPVTGLATGKTIKDWMYQFEFSVGWTYNFGAGSARAR